MGRTQDAINEALTAYLTEEDIYKDSDRVEHLKHVLSDDEYYALRMSELMGEHHRELQKVPTPHCAPC